MMFAIFSVPVRSSQWFNSSAALVHSQLVSLLLDGILNLLSLLELYVNQLLWQKPNQEPDWNGNPTNIW